MKSIYFEDKEPKSSMFWPIILFWVFFMLSFLSWQFILLSMIEGLYIVMETTQVIIKDNNILKRQRK